MRIAIIGRTRILLHTAELLLQAGHVIPIVWTARTEAYYGINEDAFVSFAHQCGAHFINGASINRHENYQFLKEMHCDIGISINYPGILKKDILDIFPKGILNAHAGDLPRYRGNACPNWAILNGEEKMGLCVHQMVPELDAGPILEKKCIAIGPDTYVKELYDFVEYETPNMFLSAINVLEQGVQPQTQKEKRPLRVFPRRPEDSRIHWKDSAENIYRLIRASSHPFAGAFTFLEGTQKVIIWKAVIHEPDYDWCAIPGQVCFAVNGDPVIACGSGMLQLTEIEGIDKDICFKKIILQSLRNRLI